MIKFKLTVIAILFVCIHHDKVPYSFSCWTKQISFEGNLIDTETCKSTVCFTTFWLSSKPISVPTSSTSVSLLCSYVGLSIKSSCTRGEYGVENTWSTWNTTHTYFVQWKGKQVTKAILTQYIVIASKCYWSVGFNDFFLYKHTGKTLRVAGIYTFVTQLPTTRTTFISKLLFKCLIYPLRISSGFASLRSFFMRIGTDIGTFVLLFIIEVSQCNFTSCYRRSLKWKVKKKTKRDKTTENRKNNMQSVFSSLWAFILILLLQFSSFRLCIMNLW